MPSTAPAPAAAFAATIAPAGPATQNPTTPATHAKPTARPAPCFTPSQNLFLLTLLRKLSQAIKSKKIFVTHIFNKGLISKIFKLS